MRIRWGRVVTVAVAAPVAVWSGAVATLWATAPAPVPGTRSTLDAREPCVAAEVLVAGVTPEDEGPGVVMVRAAQCGTLGDLHSTSFWDTFSLLREGVGSIPETQPPAAALDQLLDVWELASDEQNNGPLVHLGIWSAVAMLAAPEVGQVLADPALPADARADAARRLEAIANRKVDWDHLRPFEERLIWETTARMASEPRVWRDLLATPRTVWVARSGTHPIVDDLREDQIALRAQARLLGALAADGT